MSKPRIRKGRITGEYWCYDPPLGFNFDINKPIGYGHTPEEAYNDYVRSRDKGFGIIIIPPDTMTYKPAVTFKVAGCEDKPRRWWEIWK